MTALDPLSSEHGVLGSAREARGFAKKEAWVRRRGLYVSQASMYNMSVWATKKLLLLLLVGNYLGKHTSPDHGKPA